MVRVDIDNTKYPWKYSVKVKNNNSLSLSLTCCVSCKRTIQFQYTKQKEIYGNGHVPTSTVQ